MTSVTRPEELDARGRRLRAALAAVLVRAHRTRQCYQGTTSTRSSSASKVASASVQRTSAS
jgi:hypothetical protein